ncbi:hypothetical protein [Kitasatospora sp. NPDC004289]
MLLYNLAGPGAVAPTYTTSHPLVAQEFVLDPAAYVGYSFRNGAGAPNLVAAPAGTRLAVSQNGRFAIEAADLTRRQPKFFFADPAQLPQWNKALARAGSEFQLFAEPTRTVVFTLPGAAATTTLVRVRQANLSARTSAGGVTMTENCDVAVQNVIGSVLQPRPVLGRKPFLGSNATERTVFGDYHLANHLVRAAPLADLPAAAPARDAARDLIARHYGEDLHTLANGGVLHAPNIAADLQAIGLNQHASPTAVGQGLYSVSLGTAHPHLPSGEEVFDYAHNRQLDHLVLLNRRVWGFHWGGVVAIDGTDYLTLENYARSAENSAGNAAHLGYFQAYGALAGQDWHTRWTTPSAHGKQFANALTMVVEPEGVRGLANWVPAEKSNSAAVGTAATNTALTTALLNGLNYANVHIYAAELVAEYADPNRRIGWIQELNARIAAPPAWLDDETRALLQHVRNEMVKVKSGL